MATSRKAPAALLTVALCAAAAGCTPAAPGPSLDEPPRAAAQDLGVALVGQDPFLRGTPPAPNLGPLSSGPDPGIFETLVRLTPGFGIAPGLALRWEAVSPALWRFQLRDGVRFHNGAALDAAAAVAMLDAVAARQTHPRGLEPGSARAASAHVVEVALSAPNLRLPEQLANPSMGIQAPGTRAGAGADPASTPTGTGPFRFGSYTPGARLVVHANPDYWGRPPALRSITFRFVVDEQQAARLLAAGEVDAVGHLSPATAAGAQGHAPGRLAASQPARTVYLLLNVGGVGRWASLQDDRLRRAVALAVDRAALTTALWPDHGEPNRTLIPPAVLGDAAGAVRPPEHDPDRAGRLLDEAGWPRGPDGVRLRDGRRLILSLLLGRPAEQAGVAEVLARQLETVGIGVELLDPGPEPFAAFGRVNQATFDLFVDTRAQEDANPCALCRFFSIRPGGQLTFSGAVGAGEAADELFEDAHTVASLDSAQRLAAELMQVVTADRVVAVPLATLPAVWLLSPRVQAFEPAALGGDQHWDQVWLGG
ncbi:MAG TPA: ABC transporter substrate-binding protein [Egibacteraceae bacterium]|nr:ABC transporter substrate-binding protein [Egibacteraceae bacterium]